MAPVTRAPTPNVETGRRGRRPVAVVVHTTDGTFEGTVAWFARPSSRVSSHYLVGLDGRVVQFVDETDTASHAGHLAVAGLTALAGDSPNLVTIGIEFDDDGEPHRVDRPDAQYRAGAELLRAISGRWGIPLDHDHVLAHNQINTVKTCPGSLDIDRLIVEARVAATAESVPAPAPSGASPTRLVVLLPARNAAEDLPGWFESVERVADAVVALDDGSTDSTAAMLADHPLVEVLLRNPRRESFGGWDDSANRNRLLVAAEGSAPQWVLSLDADERLPADDAGALRAFLAGDALPGLAYGFQCFRMWGGRSDPDFRWVYRLFAQRPGQRFPAGPLHFDPVPVGLGPAQHMRTTLRIQHWGSNDDRRREARIAKYAEADPERRYPTSFGGVDEVPVGVAGWEPRPEALPVLLGARPALRQSASPSGPRTPRLAVLLPARNAAEDLPGWFESVERFADVVVALDDGSTDNTVELLAAHPLVEVVLRNPRRASYAGWDDRGNRSRLLEAAEAVEPDWLLSLDADERISADDAAALRAFLETDALPGVAYGMQCLRMIGDLDHYDRDALWVYRLFAHAPGLELPGDRLHFVPVPTSIPRERWVRTTIRIQHLAGLDEAQRRVRYDKYREADPDLEFQSTYEHLLEGPDELKTFAPRPPGLPVVLPATERNPDEPEPFAEVEDFDLDAPALSAVVISRDDEDRIERAVRSVVGQECPEPFEVIVVTSGTDRTAAIVRERFPDVRLIELDHPALPGEARNAGLRVARGDYVSFPGSHVELLPGSLAARVRAHDEGWAMVTGTTRNGTHTRSGWAAYFLDNSTVLPGRPSEQLAAAPAHCSYERRRLLAIGGFPEDLRAGEDTWVNHTLFRRGATAFRAADLPLVHHNRSRAPWQLVRRHFERGRAAVVFVRGQGTEENGSERARRFLDGYRTRRLARIDQSVEHWGAEVAEEYRRSRPLVRLGILAAWLGARVEIRRPSTRAEPLRTVGPDAAAVAPLSKPLRLRRADPAPLAGTRPIFLHVQKTAGSTLVRIMERECAPSAVLRVYQPLDEGTSLRELGAMSVEERAAVPAVAGDMPFGIDRYLPGPSAYITLLRDPVDRIVSHYHHLRSQSDGSGHEWALQGVSSLEDYVRSSPFAPMVNNGQSRQLGNELWSPTRPADRGTLDRARAALDRQNVLVGIAERFDESLALFRSSFGWGYPAYRRENVGRRPALEEVPAATIDLIRERNALDLELYEHGRARFEADLAGMTDLAGELELLRLAGRWSDRAPSR